MTENPTQLKVAIMFTDLAGYTALTERDADAALDLVQMARELHETSIEKHQGELVKEIGDGFLAIFESSLDAIACAQEIQCRSKELEFVLPIRIGLHFGEITSDRGDIFGHGVNMSSRIQAVADPGGVYLSQSIQDIVDEEKNIITEFMGAVPLKNIKEPVPVYALTGEGLTAPDKKRIDRIVKKEVYQKYYRNATILVLIVLTVAFVWFLRTYDIAKTTVVKSVAVLPLENITEESVMDYLSVGVTQELIRELAKVNSLKVISQRSTLQLAEIGGSISGMARRLNNVDYVIDGTVSMQAEQIVIQLKLHDPEKDLVIWSKEYKKAFTESRKIWAESARDMHLAMGISLSDNDSEIWEGIKSVDPVTYELYLKGMNELNKGAYSDIDAEAALNYFDQAVERNPVDAYAWAGVAAAHVLMGHGTHPSKEDRQKARASAMRAIQLDSTLAEAWTSLGMVKGYYDWDWDEAEYAYLKALELNPSLPWAHYHYSWFLALFGRMDEAILEHKRAKELDPFSPIHTAWLGYLYMTVGEYDKAIKEAELATTLRRGFLGKLMLAEIYSVMGRAEEATEIFEEVSEQLPNIPKFYFLFMGKHHLLSGNYDEGMKILADMDTLYDIKPTAWGALQRADMYTALGENDKAFQWYEYEPHHHFAPWVRYMWNIPPVKDSSFYYDPRFEQLLRRMNLPDPTPFQYNPELDSEP
jgi:class 3 adenylate cyclase/TolB-like protein/Flp pilus assembly protein TadD